MKKKIVLVLLVLLALSWYTATKSYLGNSGKYKAAMDEAQKLEEKEIYITAIDSYQTAMTYEPNDLKAMYGIATDYKNLEEYDSYTKQMKSILSTQGVQEDILQELYDYYISQDMTNDADELVYDLYRQHSDNALVASLYEERKGDYFELFNSYEKLSSFENNYTVYEKEGKQGLVDASGGVLIEARYDKIAVPDSTNGYIAVVDGSKAYYLNKKGYKIAEPDEKYSYLGPMGEGGILALKNGKYGYLNNDFSEATKFEWDEATRIYDGVGAVKKGKKWALINRKKELVTDYVYDDIITDDLGKCSVNGLVWAGKNGKYQLIDKEGNVLAKDYDGAKPFASSEPCAAEKNGSWGFVNTSGEEVIECKYEDAESFHKDFAPIKQHSAWGMIDNSGKLVMDEKYDQLYPLNDKGTVVYAKEGIWGILQMKLYE